jgi:hypothetical protein
MEKLKRNINHIETIKQLDTMFYREGRPYRLFLNKHPRAEEFDNGCYVLCTEACSGSVTFVQVSGTITHEEIHTNIISLNTREIDQYDITIMGCIDDNEVLNIIDKVKADPDKWHGMRDFEYIKGIGMPAEMDPLPDKYVYVKGDTKIRLFELNHFDEYEFNLYRVHDLREGLYAMILTRYDDNVCVEVNCTIELYPFDIYVNHIDDNGLTTSQYHLNITKLMNDYKSLKIMSMKEYHEIMTEEKTKEEENNGTTAIV